MNRRSRVVEELDRTRHQLAARRVRVPAAPDVEERRLRDLSGDIALKRGELRIEFYGAENLAAKPSGTVEGHGQRLAGFRAGRRGRRERSGCQRLNKSVP